MVLPCSLGNTRIKSTRPYRKDVNYVNYILSSYLQARMNTISGWQWFWAVGFARYSLHPSPAPSPSPLPTPTPHHHTGRFAPVLTDALAFYRTDFENALSSWGPSVEGSVAQILGASPLRCVRAPEPALVLAPRPPPCGLSAPPLALDPSPSPSPAPEAACLRDHRDEHFAHLQLGDRHSLAKLLLEQRAASAA
ncbi:hypothetical protein evm_013620 [Chilo suppressalis]|nr:hypothetical protein evm_013620 [Chilo suppressalis]